MSLREAPRLKGSVRLPRRLTVRPPPAWRERSVGLLRAVGGTVRRRAATGSRRPPWTAAPLPSGRWWAHLTHSARGRTHHRPPPLPCPLTLSPTPRASAHVPLHARPGREGPIAESAQKRNTPVVPKVTQTNKLPDVVPMLLRKRDTNLTGNRHAILHTVIAIPLSHFRRARKNKFRAKVT